MLVRRSAINFQVVRLEPGKSYSRLTGDDDEDLVMEC
jgi:hypothetical protein